MLAHVWMCIFFKWELCFFKILFDVVHLSLRVVCVRSKFLLIGGIGGFQTRCGGFYLWLSLQPIESSNETGDDQCKSRMFQSWFCSSLDFYNVQLEFMHSFTSLFWPFMLEGDCAVAILCDSVMWPLDLKLNELPMEGLWFCLYVAI